MVLAVKKELWSIGRAEVTKNVREVKGGLVLVAWRKSNIDVDVKFYKATKVLVE